jgi:pSer/pThr/pTyr-binding forkhead associated (FHA) protein
VVTRIDADDEQLEKTITLQENPVLIITAGPGSGHVFTLSLESMMSIGRAKANDIVLEDVAVSSQHCRIRPDDGQFIVHDLRSTNGTFVNDHRVTRSHLRSGDVLKIGETTMQFRMDQKRP